MELQKMYTAMFDKYEPKKCGVSFLEVTEKGGKFVNNRIFKELGRVLNLPSNLKHGDTITFISTPEMIVIEITHVNFEKVNWDDR